MATMKAIGGLTTMKGVNPMGTSNKGDGYPTQQTLALTGKKAGAKKIPSVKSAQLDGPYGGKHPVSK